MHLNYVLFLRSAFAYLGTRFITFDIDDDDDDGDDDDDTDDDDDDNDDDDDDDDCYYCNYICAQQIPIHGFSCNLPPKGSPANFFPCP